MEEYRVVLRVNASSRRAARRIVAQQLQDPWWRRLTRRRRCGAELLEVTGYPGEVTNLIKAAKTIMGFTVTVL